MRMGKYYAALDDFAEENLVRAQQELAAEDNLSIVFSNLGADKIIQQALEEKTQQNFDKAEMYFKIVNHFDPKSQLTKA